MPSSSVRLIGELFGQGRYSATSRKKYANRVSVARGFRSFFSGQWRGIVVNGVGVALCESVRLAALAA